MTLLNPDDTHTRTVMCKHPLSGGGPEAQSWALGSFLQSYVLCFLSEAEKDLIEANNCDFYNAVGPRFNSTSEEAPLFACRADFGGKLKKIYIYIYHTDPHSRADMESIICASQVNEEGNWLKAQPIIIHLIYNLGSLVD